MPGRFAETVGLDDSFEKKNPGPGCPTYLRQPDRKKQGEGHGVKPHAHDMQNRASCSTCHAKKNKLFHVSCKKTSCSTCQASQNIHSLYVLYVLYGPI